MTIHRTLATLVLALFGPHPSHAAVKPCAVQSPELILARECFSGDMRDEAEPARFVGVDEASAVGLKYCYDAFVVPYPVEGARLTLLVLKDDPAGQMVARTYQVSVAALAASLGRTPGARGTQILTLKGLEATCVAGDARKAVCSKGFFGFGSTDLPFALALEGDPRGYKVRGPVRDRARIEAPGVPNVPASLAAPGPTLDYLAGQVRTRLTKRARLNLARLKANPTSTTAQGLTRDGVQFGYCRLAFENVNLRLKREDPFSADEHAVFAELDRRMTNPTDTPTTTPVDTAREPASPPPEDP